MSNALLMYQRDTVESLTENNCSAPMSLEIFSPHLPFLILFDGSTMLHRCLNICIGLINNTYKTSCFRKADTLPRTKDAKVVIAKGNAH